MGLKAEIAGVTVVADTAAELADLIRELRSQESGPPLAIPSTPAGVQVALTAPSSPSPKQKPMRKLYGSIDDVGHKRTIEFLAHRGPANGATDEEIKEHAKVQGKLSGFTGSINKRAVSLGLKPTDVMIVDKLGVTLGKRNYRYRLTRDMCDVILGEKEAP